MALTGYLIIQKRDINPQSPTYNQIVEDRQLSEECQPTAPDWVELTAYCEYGEDGKPTGQYVHVEIDQAKNSESYGQTREWKEAASEGQCEMADDTPEWILDETYDNHCETKVFEPSKVVGETGRFICRVVDENVYSPTYGQRVETAYTESDWIFEEEFPCEAVDIRPKVEEISYSCVLSTDASGAMIQTGEIDIFGMDKNPYSSTYLSTTTIRETDFERCPPNTCEQRYGFVDLNYHTSASSGSGGVALTSVSAGTLTFSSGKSSNWISFQEIQSDDNVNAYVCAFEANNTGAQRVGYAVFSSSDGCEFSGTVTQGGDVPVVKVEYRVVFAENNNPNVEYIMDLRFTFSNGSDEREYDTVRPSEGFRVGTEGKLYADEGYTYNRASTLAVNSGTVRPPSDLTLTVDNASKIITVKYTYTGNI